MHTWTDYTLGELVINHDAARRPVKSSARVSGDTPYYGASGIVDRVDGYTHDGHFLLISEDGENLRSRSTPIAFETHGRIWVNNHAHVVSGREPADTRFLKYALAMTELTGYLTGSAQPKLSRSAMDSIRLKLPESDARQAIAEVLGALDDKIAANDRIVGLSDELTAAKFRVLSDSRGSANLRTIGTVNRAVSKPEAGGELRYLDISSVGRGTYEYPGLMRWEDAPGRARRVVTGGDTVWSTVRPNRRSHALVLDEDPLLIASTGLAVLSPNAGRAAGLYEAARTEDFVSYLESVAEGSAYPAVRADRFLEAPVPDLRCEEWDEFETFALPLRKRAHSAMVESRRLAEMRDGLLPLLMSGKVRVRLDGPSDQSGNDNDEEL